MAGVQEFYKQYVEPAVRNLPAFSMGEDPHKLIPGRAPSVGEVYGDIRDAGGSIAAIPKAVNTAIPGINSAFGSALDATGLARRWPNGMTPSPEAAPGAISTFLERNPRPPVAALPLEGLPPAARAPQAPAAAIPPREQVIPENPAGGFWGNTSWKEGPGKMNSMGAYPGAIPTGDYERAPTLAANPPAGFKSPDPSKTNMENYEYKGQVNGKDVYTWKDQNKGTLQGSLNEAMTMLTEYRSDPEKWGPKRLNAAIDAISKISQAITAGQTAQSTAEYQKAHGGLLTAQAGAIPTTMDETMAKAEKTRAEAAIEPARGKYYEAMAGKADAWMPNANAQETPEEKQFRAAIGPFTRSFVDPLSGEFNQVGYQAALPGFRESFLTPKQMGKPPVEGAKQAPDGKWYVANTDPKSKGKNPWLLVEPKEK